MQYLICTASLKVDSVYLVLGNKTCQEGFSSAIHFQCYLLTTKTMFYKLPAGSAINLRAQLSLKIYQSPFCTKFVAIFEKWVLFVIAFTVVSYFFEVPRPYVLFWRICRSCHFSFVSLFSCCVYVVRCVTCTCHVAQE